MTIWDYHECLICHGMVPVGVPHSCGGTPTPIIRRHSFTPNQLTEADIRRIIREELENVVDKALEIAKERGL